MNTSYRPEIHREAHHPPATTALSNGRNGRRISWGAVVAGTVLALVIQLALNLLGIGIGLSAIVPQQEQTSFSIVGIGSTIWWVLGMLISLYLGGSVAGRLAGIPRRLDGLLHGLLTWGLVTLLTFFLPDTALGRTIGGATSVTGQTLSGTGRGIVAVVPGAAMKGEFQERGIDLTDLKREATMLLHFHLKKPEDQT